jgi:hypothetical protein
MKQFAIKDSLGETIDVITINNENLAQAVANRKYPLDKPIIKLIKTNQLCTNIKS